MTVYLESSAATKLAKAEPPAPALREWLIGKDVVTSTLTSLESKRAAMRSVDPVAAAQVLDAVLDNVFLLSIDEYVVHRAARVEPTSLRSLDAIHLVTAQRMGDYLESFVTYDRRLADAARAVGLPVESPGS